MAGKTKIKLFHPALAQGETGEVVGDPTLFRELWATRTDSGGRDNIYASRIVHENETVFTVRYIDGVSPDMLVEFNATRRPISSIIAEGFKKVLHIKVTIKDLEYEATY